MPPVLLAFIAGAGLYAGFKWARQVAARAEAFKATMTAEAERTARAEQGPRDLGNLEWDSESQVYRPKIR